ncbi:MAG: hypothetical protein GW748_04565 [Alphaproteobacteria bacterium]|nr:hypothetical protein [Alphaproteobacteria bacterium]NCQ66997.1 hypothetical protein [Alphaproteobacteria bacterium]NCT07594.1 hypothetical protein [Alphaproteobacteria bacterium]
MYLFMGLLIVFAGLTVLKMHVFPPNKAPWILGIPIAHRGFFDNDKNIPENSLMAFQRAAERAYAIELDVHLTKDRKIIVHHDFTLERLSGSNKRLDELTLSEIQKHTLLATEEVPPTLEEVLSLVDDRVPVYVEIKRESYGAAGDLETETLRVLEKYEGRVAILSFNPQSLAFFAQNAPQFYRGQNYEPSKEKLGGQKKILQAVLSQAWQARPHFFVYNSKTMPEILLRGFSFVRHLIPYNVNSHEDYQSVSPYASNVIFEKINF